MKYSDLDERDRISISDRIKELEKKFAEDVFLLWMLKSFQDESLDKKSVSYSEAKKMLEGPNIEFLNITPISFDSFAYIGAMTDFQKIMASINKKK